MLNLMERSFVIGQHTLATYQTYEEMVEILEQSAGLQYPELRSRRGKEKYEQAFTTQSNRNEQLREIEVKIGYRKIALLVNKFPYTAIRAVAEGSVLHTVVWWNTEKGIQLRNSEISKPVIETFGSAVCAWAMQHLERNRTVGEICHAHVFVDVATCR